MSRTRVYITVDVECAEERVSGGRTTPAQGWDVRVWGRFKNQRAELGIGLIMRELEAYGLAATFFTEVFGSYSFGRDDLRAACLEMRQRGHDVQLHTHPIQRRARWRSLGEEPDSDEIATYPVDEQARLLAEGRDILASCGVPRDDLLAFRAGHYAASNGTWDAMRRTGLVVSSNYNPCYFHKCRIRVDKASPGLFAAGDGVFELPVSNFVERGGGHRHVQITAVSLAEMKDHLRQARRLGIGEVTLVTHSFEFFHVDSIEGRLGRPNSVNVLRLRGLAEFLAKNERDFEVETVGALAKRLAGSPAQAAQPNAAPPMPRGRRRHRARRLIEQAYKRVEARLPFSARVL